MERQTEFKHSPPPSVGLPPEEAAVRPEWKRRETRPRRADGPMVEIPGFRGVESAGTPAPAAASRPPDRVAQAIKDLVNLLPDKPAAVGLENGLVGIVMCLDPVTRELTVPFLEEHCGFQPYVPPTVETVGPALNAHILIVEDAYISRLVLRRVIEQLAGCTVTEAVDGAQALELLKKGLSPDLMIADMCMPELDGLQLLSQIRATPYLSELAVMMCTSTTDRDSVVRAAELNVAKYLVKPFQPDEVREQIREVLTAAQSRANEKVQALKDRLGLSSAACGELLHQLAEQVRSEVRAVRNELGSGKAHAALLTLQRLRGSCALIKDNSLVARVQSVIQSAQSKDLFEIVKGLEMLEEEGKRLGSLAAKLKRIDEPADGGRSDPLSQAAARVQAGTRGV